MSVRDDHDGENIYKEWLFHLSFIPQMKFLKKDITLTKLLIKADDTIFKWYEHALLVEIFIYIFKYLKVEIIQRKINVYFFKKQFKMIVWELTEKYWF